MEGEDSSHCQNTWLAQEADNLLALIKVCSLKSNFDLPQIIPLIGIIPQ
jgi:hypothetical protein